MVKKGDTVRYLNAVGGGKVVRVEGRIAYVDDDGFETPVQTSDLVVVLPAGHEPEGYGKKMFDQSAFDAGKTDKRATPKPAPTYEEPIVEDFPIEETEYGDDMTLVLAFEPEDVKKLAETPINAVLVNDSNYFVEYQILCRSKDQTAWVVEYSGEAAPNELVDLGKYTQQSVKDLERIVFQAIARKVDKPFDFKTPISVSRKLDLTKFYKLHCFHAGVYFDTPVLEVPLYADAVRKNKNNNKNQSSKNQSSKTKK